MKILYISPENTVGTLSLWKQIHESRGNECKFVTLYEAKHDYDSVTHVDGTARVQLVEKDNVSILRPILEEWYEETGCPMLLNTSLNIKGQPMVNTWEDAKEFERKYNVPVF